MHVITNEIGKNSSQLPVKEIKKSTWPEKSYHAQLFHDVGGREKTMHVITNEIGKNSSQLPVKEIKKKHLARKELSCPALSRRRRPWEDDARDH